MGPDMFEIEHRKGEAPLARQLSYTRSLSEALASAHAVAIQFGADHMTVIHEEGDLIAVFRTQARPNVAPVAIVAQSRRRAARPAAQGVEVRSAA